MASTRPVVPGIPPDLRRSTDDRMVGGVCAGIGAYLGVDPVVIRLAVAVLTLVSGFGVLLYVAAWLLIPEGDVVTPPSTAKSRRGREQAIAIGFVTVGGLLLLRSLGLWFPDELVWPVAIAAVGLGVVWARTDDARNADPAKGPGERMEDAFARATPFRIGIGAALVLAGAVTFIVTSDSFATLGAVGTAVIVTAAGAALLAGPWVLRLWSDLDVERRERIRQEERAEVAAHLHDSVLQTLALIQRRSSSPDETTQLARRQERELRAWLYGVRDPTHDTLAGALEAVADEVEADHAVTVDVVTAGDCPLDDRLRAMVEAVREGVVNAAKHAGVREVSVFAEVHGDAVTAYVRDPWRGFDPTLVNGDRRGIAESIVGRMERHGGTATVWSEPGEGTEVVLDVRGATFMTTRVFLVDDHRLFLSGVRAELGERVEIVGEALDVESAVERIRATHPEVVLLDVHLPGGGGKAVIEAIKSSHPDIVFLALSVSDAAEDVIAIIRAGARGYVTKTIETDELSNAIERVREGDAVFSPRLAGFVLDAFAGDLPPGTVIDPELDQLTPREREVLRLIARGYTYKEIARRLSLSVKTVETHVSAVLRKLQLSSRHELTRWATDRRLV